ncbi:DinB family protein [Taibaiella koreensis]|uniref:DinB family protein n=1 Tax=Taibaiella koreensis TaxID=1268548 RepID=UPI000E59E6A7|nr:DinB family protein [Taibaiella koreensis]
MPISTQIQQWQQKLDELSREFRERFADLPEDELKRKPNAQTWSIAENMQHLITVNESYFPLLEQLKGGTYKPPFLSRIPFFVKFMGNTLLKSVEPARKNKMRTFPMWEPVAADIHGDIVTDFEKHQSALKQAIAAAAPFLEKDTVIASPVNRNIVYTLEKAFDIIVTHEERHLNQAIEAFEVIYQNQYKYDL